MPLPNVSGWLMDFRTARAIYSSKINQRISHCTDLLNASRLRIAWCEEDAFKDVPALKSAFLGPLSAVEKPVDEILDRCMAIDPGRCGKKVLGSGELEASLSGIALHRNFGIISDHRSVRFATVYDIGPFYGFVVLSQDEYFALL